ncbi:hypothetical protein ACFX1T_032169 [Malus domestica]
MKNNKVDFVAKMAPRPISFSVETDSHVKKEVTARVGSCEKSTKSTSGEVVEICALLKPDLLEDMNTYANFIDSVRGIVCPSSFATYTVTSHIAQGSDP